MGHDEDPVTHPDDLGKLARNHKDGAPGVGNSINKLVDLDLGTDVDTPSWLVQQQN